MVIPPIYTNEKSPLYDCFRDKIHQPPTLVDLNYSKNNDGSASVENNLCVVYKSVVSCGKTPSVFLGKPFHPGEEPNNSAGSVESVPHTPGHIWTGDRNQPNGEDMGRFYSAGRDPIFYSHHANVDRMLNISKTIKGGKRRDSLTLIG